MFDLSSGAGIWSHDAAHSSILVLGPHLYLNTGTGVDNTHRKIRRPDAPSLVVLDKATGRYLARDQEGIGPNIFHSTWAPPSAGVVNGRTMVFLAAGNGFIYAFEPLASSPQTASSSPMALKKVWQYDFDPTAPKSDVHRFHLNKREGPSNFYGAPVVQDGRLYLAGGGDLWWGKNEAQLQCLDISSGPPQSRWSHPLVRHTFSTAAVHDGLVYVSDCSQNLHCVEASTGRSVWRHELNGETWASPLVADGKVFIGTRRGWFHVFAAGRSKQLLFEIDLKSPISATAVAANGRLYVTTMNRLLALASGSIPTNRRTSPFPAQQEQRPQPR
jgi:outer membrane protein assembly factor BamB